MKTGVIDVGGGLRGIYAAGVLDYCIDNNINFDLGIGVSAGSANLASYTAKQRGRNYQFYTNYSFRKQYMGIGNLISNGSFINMDYIYGTLSVAGGENPLNYPVFHSNPMDLYVVATEAKTGKTKYFDKDIIQQDVYDALKASSSIPLICKPYTIQGIPYFDGALGDPVPIKKAFQLGCDRVILILTKPAEEIRKSRANRIVANAIRNKYPAAARQLYKIAQMYNESITLAKDYEKQGKVLIISPDDTCGVDTLTRNKKFMEQLYNKGYNDGKKISVYL